ncbi:MAG TPA: transcriptional regulator GcvA [Azospirillaceae bacterium]|nr:transcriptional regulator GcvA [Azospirillaceae bacterium]
MRRLPPLAALRAFEAAGRHGNFTRAAEELRLTHGAISRHVKNLEEWLGTPLFLRRGGRTALTDVGRRYLAEVATTLDRLEIASSGIAAQGARRILHVSAGHSFAVKWLLPRLGRFTALHPGVEVRLATSADPLNAVARAFDVAVRGGPDSWPDLVGGAFMAERRFPVCLPGVAARLSRPADLAREVLIHAASVREAWSNWLRLAGVPEVAPARTLLFDHMYLASEAAAAGLGVAIGSAALLRDELAAGRLVAPFPDLVLEEKRYHWYRHASASDTGAAAAFCRWLEAEGAEA